MFTGKYCETCVFLDKRFKYQENKCLRFPPQVFMNIRGDPVTEFPTIKYPEITVCGEWTDIEPL